MNKQYTQYAARTGRIIGILSLPDSADIFDLHHSLLFDGVASGETHYIVDGAPSERPSQSTAADNNEVLADGTDIVTISSIPAGATLSVTGPVNVSQQQIDDGEAELVFDVPGDYIIHVECFPYLSWQATVKAN